MDRAEQRELIAYRLDRLRTLVPMFADFVDKDLARGNRLGALADYQAFVLRPLVEALGIRYCPARFDYGARYAAYDFPPEVAARLERLWLVCDSKELAERRREAETWLHEILIEIDEEGIGL
jgi:hypothetical protein